LVVSCAIIFSCKEKIAMIDNNDFIKRIKI
jgi:hypothetical protein